MDSKREHLIQLLTNDVIRTVGGAHRATVMAEVRRALEFTDSVEAFAQKLVDDVQQDLHDTFVDTAWPTCPRHGRHPLWYRDGAWWCEADRVALAQLGELPVRQAAV